MSLKIVICITFIGIVSIQAVENIGLSCGRNQNCIRYNECPSALKIVDGILTTAYVMEQQNLFRKFSQLRCGNHITEKTVCCDQDNAEGGTAEGKYKTVLVFSLYIVSIQPVEQ